LKKILLLTLLIVLTLTAGCSRGTSQRVSNEYAVVINADNPGENIDIMKHVESGKITVFDFYSEYCPPCKTIAPQLAELDKARPDIVVKKIDINRKDHKGIDWQSPVVQQYKIQSVPYFIIYNENGKVMASGREATEKVFEYLGTISAGK
jgi:thiol-disulfide isomerase/thioredoxin